MLTCIVKEWPQDLISLLEPELDRIAKTPTNGEVSEEVDLEARELLRCLHPK